MSIRQEKVASLLQKLIAREFIALRDPRLQLVTITEVKPSPDLSHARVFYLLHDPADRPAAEAALIKATGHFRSMVGRELKMRVTPELHFIYDETEVKAMHLEGLLDKLKQRRPAEQAEGETVPEVPPKPVNE